MTHGSDIFFLVGAERSGTTVVRLMLNHHPRIGWINEFEYAVDRMTHPSSWPELAAYYDWLETHRIFRATGFEIDHDLGYRELVQSFLEQCRQSFDRPIIGANVHRNFDRLLRIWPNAKFLHLVRDPRDVARSCIRMGWAGNVWCGVERWLEVERTWQSLRNRLDKKSYYEFRFEDVMQSPEKELTAICTFLGVEYSPLMLTYDSDTTYSRPDPSLTYQWKRKLSNREIEMVEGRVGDSLTTYGYERQFETPRTPSRFAQFQLKIQDRWARIAFRRRRYGIGLWLAMVLCKRLGPDSLRKKIQLRTNSITQSHLK